MLTEPLAPLDAVIRRLPGGVDYSCVKMIIHDVPAPLTAWSWRSRAEHDGSHRNHYGRAWAAFSNCSYRVIDRLTPQVDFPAELKRGNIAVAIFIAALFIAIAMIVGRAIG